MATGVSVKTLQTYTTEACQGELSDVGVKTGKAARTESGNKKIWASLLAWAERVCARAREDGYGLIWEDSTDESPAEVEIRNLAYGHGPERGG